MIALLVAGSLLLLLSGTIFLILILRRAMYNMYERKRLKPRKPSAFSQFVDGVFTPDPQGLADPNHLTEEQMMVLAWEGSEGFRDDWLYCDHAGQFYEESLDIGILQNIDIF